MPLPRAGRRRVAVAGASLAVLRRRIDALDRRIVRLLGRRLRVVRALRPYKRHIPDPRREVQVLAQVRGEARRCQADPVFVAEVYRGLLGASRAFQKRAS